MAKETPKETRPAVTTPPGGMAPPPGSLGKELEAAQTDTRPAATANTPPDSPPFKAEGPAAPTGGQLGNPDGQLIQGSGPPHQPQRPDLSTQQPRPTVGGSAPQQTHPDNLAVSGVQEFPLDVPETDEEKALREKREQADKEGGNVYLVQKTNTMGLTGHVTESDLGNADIPFLLKQGVLSPVGHLRGDPRRARALGKEGQEEIDRMQTRCNELQADVDRLEEENKKKEGQIADLRKQLEDARKK